MPDGAPIPVSATGPTDPLVRLAGSRRFHRLAARVPLLRRLVRAEGEAMFDLVAGFCHSQILQAFVLFDLPSHLTGGPRTTSDLSRGCAVPEARMVVLLQAAAALGLVRCKRGMWRLTPRGAALAAVPGLPQMIRHHEILYRDLSDPVRFFRGTEPTELARFWPYVFGAGAAEDPARAAAWSRLMTDSQALVAEDTLALNPFAETRHLMDVGGGSGAFLSAVRERHPDLDMTLFDLPAVMPSARARLGDDPGIGLIGGSFRDDPLPGGADTISLIRILYDHDDQTVAALLRAVYTALPPGGRVVVSEPMTGGARPNRSGDAYFALYCMAMQTGRARSASEISALLQAAGFVRVRTPTARRPFVTSVITAFRGET